jgi:uroporphyrinogen-III decarboxylase
MDMAPAPDIAEAILDIPFKYHLTVTKKLVQLGVDMIWIGDDVGAQHTMIISPDQWREFLKPRMKQYIAELKGLNPNIKIAYHSDGNIYPIINDLIEIGLDVLNPVQPGSMDPAKIKAEFGKDLCFWGTIDEQHTLPFGTTEDVRDEVRRRLATIGANGGLIIGPTHHVQLDTPMENVFAMVEEIKRG